MAQRKTKGTCPYCTEEFVNLESHVASQHKICLECDAKLSEDKIFKHMANKHDWKVFCKYCDYKTLFELKDHEALHHFACYKCEEQNHKSLSELLLHHESNHPNIRQLGQCAYCAFISITGSVKNHMKKAHVSGQVFKCVECDMNFTSAETLEKHWKESLEKSEESSTFKCKYCDAKSCTPDALSSHVKSEHEVVAKLQNCEFCPKKFKTQMALRQHAKLCCFGNKESLKKTPKNSQELPDRTTCGIDKEQPEQQGDDIGFGRTMKNVKKTPPIKGTLEYLWQNQKTKNETTAVKNEVLILDEQEELKCKNCDFTFSLRASLNRHEKKFAGHGSIHKCKFCSFKSCTKKGLEIHVEQKHESILPHKCSNCLKKFSSIRTLLAHLKKYCKTGKTVREIIQDHEESKENIEVEDIVDAVETTEEPKKIYYLLPRPKRGKWIVKLDKIVL